MLQREFIRGAFGSAVCGRDTFCCWFLRLLCGCFLRFLLFRHGLFLRCVIYQNCSILLFRCQRFLACFYGFFGFSIRSGCCRSSFCCACIGTVNRNNLCVRIARRICFKLVFTIETEHIVQSDIAISSRHIRIKNVFYTLSGHKRCFVCLLDGCVPTKQLQRVKVRLRTCRNRCFSAWNEILYNTFAFVVLGFNRFRDGFLCPDFRRVALVLCVFTCFFYVFSVVSERLVDFFELASLCGDLLLFNIRLCHILLHIRVANFPHNMVNRSVHGILVRFNGVRDSVDKLCGIINNGIRCAVNGVLRSILFREILLDDVRSILAQRILDFLRTVFYIIQTRDFLFYVHILGRLCVLQFVNRFICGVYDCISGRFHRICVCIALYFSCSNRQKVYGIVVGLVHGIPCRSFHSGK